MTAEELEAVLAHEISHYKWVIFKSLALSAIMGGASFGLFRLRRKALGFMNNQDSNSKSGRLGPITTYSFGRCRCI